MFQEVEPMLCAKPDAYWIDKAMNSPDWVAEEKYDGSRYICQFDEKGIPRVTSRRTSVVTGKKVVRTENFPHIIKPIPELAGCIFDGEMLGPKGFGSTVSVCGSLPAESLAYQKEHGYATYYIFDMLCNFGEDIQKNPWSIRREKMVDSVALWRKCLLGGGEKYLGNVICTRRGKDKFRDEIYARGGEGIILKHMASPYIQGARKKEYWMKVKKQKTFDVIVTGVTEPEKYSVDSNGMQTYNHLWVNSWIAAIKFGVYRGDELVEVGKTSGMNERVREAVSDEPERFMGKVMEVEGMELTPDGAIRHPRFIRFRDDKDPEECTYKAMFEDKARKAKAIKKEGL